MIKPAWKLVRIEFGCDRKWLGVVMYYKLLTVPQQVYYNLCLDLHGLSYNGLSHSKAVHLRILTWRIRTIPYEIRCITASSYIVGNVMIVEM